MDDTTDTFQVDQSDELEPWREEYPPVDPVLSALVQHANVNEEFGVGVTLHLPGGIISGVIAGAGPWSSKAADMYPDAASVFRSMGPQEGQEISGDPAFIHLTDAEMLGLGGRYAGINGTFWRGRLEHVAGWSMLRFASNDPQAGESIS